MAVVDSSITLTTAASFVPEVWSTEVLEAAEFAAVLAKRVNTRWEDDMAIGSIYHVPRLSNLTTQSKASGISNTITFEAISESKQDVQVSTHEYAAFLLEQVVAVQANQDLRAKYTKKIGYALARGVEVTLANLIPNFTTNVVGTYGVELVSDDYLQAWTLLAQAGLLEDNPAIGEDFTWVLSPAAYAGALKIDIFTNTLYNPEADSVQRADIGNIYGGPVFRSNLLNSPSASQHANALFHRDALALVIQKEVPVASQYLIRNLADGVVGWHLYGTSRILFPPEADTTGGPDTYTAIDNRGVLVKSV